MRRSAKVCGLSADFSPSDIVPLPLPRQIVALVASLAKFAVTSIDRAVKSSVRVESERTIQRYDKAAESLLQLAGSDPLLVHRLVDGVGNSKPCGNLLASSPCLIGCNVPLRDGRRLLRQLV